LRIAALALLLLAVPKPGMAGNCASRPRPFVTVTHAAAWVPAVVKTIEISDDRTIAIGPFEHGCPLCGSLTRRELLRVKELVRDVQANTDLKPLLNGSCRVLDTSITYFWIEGQRYGLCEEEVPSLPAVDRLVREIDRIQRRHFPGVRRRRQRYPHYEGCAALHENTRRRWECRQIFPWKPEPATPAAPAVDLSSVAMTFAVEPAETLPGLPLSLRIGMSNQGSTPIVVPQWFALEVIPERGEPFMAVAQDPDEATYRATLYFGAKRALAPAESATLDIPAGAMLPYWQYGFSELACLEPGRYRLRLIADDSFTVDRPGPRRLSGSLAGSVTSNETTLTVIAPRGVDAGAWRLARRRGPFWGMAPFPELWQRYPGSAYAAYGVPVALDERKNHRAIIELFGAALGRNPRGLFGDIYRLRIAEARRARGVCLARRNDVAASRAEKQAARELLVAIPRQSLVASLASSELDTARRMPEKLSDFFEYSLSRARWVRSELAAGQDDGARSRTIRALDDFIAALDAVPPDEEHALSLLNAAIAELQNVQGSDPWIDALRDSARSFGYAKITSPADCL
jgi:hypothetical protein